LGTKQLPVILATYNLNGAMKILLVQTSFLGDTILSTPLIAAIKKIHPECELWMMTTAISKELVKDDPMLSGTIIYDKGGKEKGISGMLRKAKEIRQQKFDCAYSLHKSYRTAILLKLAGIPETIGFKQAALSFLYSKKVVRDTEPHDVLRNLSLLKLEPEFLKSGKSIEEFFDTEIRLFPNSNIDLSGKFFEVTQNPKPKAILVPGSAWKTKRWDWKGFHETALYLEKEGYQVILIGAANEKEVCDKVAGGTRAVNLAGKTSIAESLVVIKSAALVVCNDSMSLHIASAFKVPNVAVFCATSPKFGFGPWKNRALVVEKEGLSCKPCRRHGSNTCPTGTEACMKDLPSGQVINAIEKLIPIGQNRKEGTA
jgi:heptosyltransferase-2